jgi:serine/threonine protein kinase
LALTPGTRLRVYEITAPIGGGGMGQVYRARDTKLNRDVALEVLPDAFAARTCGAVLYEMLSEHRVLAGED